MNKIYIYTLFILTSLKLSTSLKAFETILMSYDNSLRPVIHGPVIINVSIAISSMEINDVRHTLKIYAELQQVWEDIHLRYPSVKGKSSIGLQGDRWAKMKHHLWLPDVDFAGNYYADRTQTGDFLKIEENGKMTWSQKIIAEFPCTFDFTEYPFDENKCSIKLHSVGYNYKELNARWSIDQAVHFKKEKLVYPRYKVKDIAVTSTSVVHMFKAQRQLEAKFTFKTRRGYAIKHTVLPFIVAVLTAYLSFYINIRGIASRLIVCASALIFALVFHEISYRDSPKVYYVMAVEVFTSSCLTFIWIAIAETVVIDILGRTSAKMNPHHSFGDERSELNESDSSRGHVVAMWVDRCFRILYPALFLIFNAIFWIVYH